MLGRPGNLPGRSYPESINSATWSKLDISRHLDEPSPFPSLDVETVDNKGSLRTQAGGSSKLTVPEPSTSTKHVDLYKIMKKARSDREKLAYMAQFVVRYPGETEDLDQRLDKYLNLLDYETSRREFLSVCVWTISSHFFAIPLLLYNVICAGPSWLTYYLPTIYLNRP